MSTPDRTLNATASHLPPPPPAARGALTRASVAAGAAVAVGAADSYTEAITDLGNPASFFPTARALERTVVAHLGPTNRCGLVCSAVFLATSLAKSLAKRFVCFQ